MGYDVSSWFIGQTMLENPPTLDRVFTIAGSDYSDFVLSWPTINSRWDELKPNNVTINLSNEDQTFNFFKTAKENVQAPCVIKFGFKVLDGDNSFPYEITSSSVGSLNQVFYSQEFDQSSYWFLSFSGTIVPNALVAPDGTTTGAWFNDPNSSNPAYIKTYSGPHYSTPSGVVRDIIGSIYIAKDNISSRNPLFRMQWAPTTKQINVVLDTQTGASSIYWSTSMSVSKFGVTDVGSWWRVWAMGSHPLDSSSLDISLWLYGDSLNSTVTSLGVWGAQLSWGDESIDLFTGTVGEVSFKDASVSLRLVDKIQKLSDRIVGTSNSAAVFSSSTMLPSDILWTSVTCYGGYSSVKSSNNPDIDYNAFLAWAAVFSADQVYMGASFKGTTVTEVLRKIMQNTHSTSYLVGNRLFLARWTTVNTFAPTLTSDQIKSLGIKIRADALVNKSWVEFDYKTNSNFWNGAVFAANTPSVNSYGIRESITRDESIWYVSSANALNMAQRILFVNALPYEEVSVDSTLYPLSLTVGDTLVAVDPHLDLSEGWRVMGMSVNVDQGSITLDINGSQTFTNTSFLLDYSALDGSDILL